MLTHRGGCLCGRVRFEVVAPTSVRVTECNCSVCGVKSFYVPRSHPDGYSVNARWDGKNWEKTYGAAQGKFDE